LTKPAQHKEKQIAKMYGKLPLEKTSWHLLLHLDYTGAYPSHTFGK